MYQQALDKDHPAAEKIADELARRLKVQRDLLTTDAARLGEALTHLNEVT